MVPSVFPQGSISCYFCVRFEPKISFIKPHIISGDSSGAVSEKYTLCCQTKEQTRECFREHFSLCWGDGRMERRLLPPAQSCSLKSKRGKEKGSVWENEISGGTIYPLNVKQLGAADIIRGSIPTRLETIRESQNKRLDRVEASIRVSAGF